MRLILTTHAKDRMKERNITEGDVHKCVAEYVEKVDGRSGVRYKGPGVTRRAMLKVWVVPKSDVNDRPKVVKSVAWEGDDDE